MARKSDGSGWADCARDLGQALQDASNLTVFLGAGASVSSGAPGTSEVEGLLSGMFKRFGSSGNLLSNLHRVADGDKAVALRGRFEGLVPFIGYRCLAALGRARRVLVINMNWDPLLLSACDRLGVPCLSFDLRDRDSWPSSADLEGFRGIVDVHFHGDLANPRHGGPDIQWQTPEQVDYLKAVHSGARRVYLGLSLDVDHDVVQLGAAFDEGEQGWTYGFFRGVTEDGRGIASRINALQATDPIFVQTPEVDFDRILLVITDVLADEDQKWGAQERHLRLPSLERVVLPTVEVLAPSLDARCSVLIGEAQIGKTTAARLVGYLHRALAPAPCSVRYVDALSAPAALGAPEHEDETDLLVVESPFGEADHMAVAPTLMQQVRAWTAPGMASPKLLITSRVGAYDESPLPEAGFSVSDPAPSHWFRIDGLREFARVESDDNPHIVDKVDVGWLDTPARIKEAVAGVSVPRSEQPRDRERQAVGERRGMLDRNAALAALCVLVRLQEFGGEPLAVSTFQTLLPGGRFPGGAAADLMLHHYDWDNRERIRLVHALDRDATDDWIGDHRDVVGRILEQALCPQSLKDGWDGWTLCDDARHGRFAELQFRDAAVVGQHLSAMLDVRPGAEVLALVESAGLDEWSAHDLAFSLIRLWGDLPHDERHRVLRHLLGLEDAVGTYGVLEACLYLRGAAPQEVLDAVRDQLWEFVNHGVRRFEVALALDGFAWRVPPETGWVRDWADEALREDPVLVGSLPVIAAYHPGGAEEIGLASRLARARIQAMSDDAAAFTVRLVRWHFVHQSRARAMLARQHWLDKWYLCRSFLPDPGESDSADVLWLLQVLADQGEPGWGFFAACFLMGGLQQDLSNDARQRAHELLLSAGVADVGVLAASATYSAAGSDPFSETIRAYFEDDNNFDPLLDSLSKGFEVEGFEIRPPRFAFWNDVADIYRWLGIRFERLGPWQPSDLDKVVLDVKHAVDCCIADGIGTSASGAELVAKVALGDLRPLEVAAFNGGVGLSLDDLVALALRGLDATSA